MPNPAISPHVRTNSNGRPPDSGPGGADRAQRARRAVIQRRTQINLAHQAYNFSPSSNPNNLEKFKNLPAAGLDAGMLCAGDAGMSPSPSTSLRAAPHRIGVSMVSLRAGVAWPLRGVREGVGGSSRAGVRWPLGVWPPACLRARGVGASSSRRLARGVRCGAGEGIAVIALH